MGHWNQPVFKQGRKQPNLPLDKHGSEPVDVKAQVVENPL